MSFLELAQNRYTSKMYCEEKISEEKIHQLAEILRLSPSSINSQPWQFTIISDQEIKNKLAEFSMEMNQERVKTASHLVVFRGYADLEKFEAQINEILPEGFVQYYHNVVKTSQEAAVHWIEKQVYISLGFFLSACASMGIDATPMEGIFPAEYDKMLGTAEGYKTLCAVAIGYRNPEDFNQPSKNPKQRLPLEKVVKIKK